MPSPWGPFLPCGASVGNTANSELKGTDFYQAPQSCEGRRDICYFFLSWGKRVCWHLVWGKAYTFFLWPHTFCKQSCNEGCILMHLSIKDLEHGVERNLFSNMSKAVLQNACVIFKPTLEQTTATVVWRRPRWLHSHGHRDNVSPAKHDSYTGFTISDMGHRICWIYYLFNETRFSSR